MTTFLDLQNEVLLTLHGFGLAQPRATFLDAAISDTDLVWSVSATDDIDMGIAEVESELVFVESVDRAAGNLHISRDGRGYYSTTPVEHPINTRVTFAPTWPRTQVKKAINHTIANTYPTLFGVAQHQFTYTPAVTTYSVPAEAERILSVTADVNGPSMEQQRITRYSFQSTAPTDDWATTNSLTLQEGVTPGRTVTVTYVKQPSELTADADLLTASGLRSTASRAVVYGTVAELVTFMDVSRLPVDSSTADEVDSENQMGLASRLGNQYQLRYELELERERQRLRATTPVPITMRNR